MQTSAGEEEKESTGIDSGDVDGKDARFLPMSSRSKIISWAAPYAATEMRRRQTLRNGIDGKRVGGVRRVGGEIIAHVVVPDGGDALAVVETAAVRRGGFLFADSVQTSRRVCARKDRK